MFGDKWYVRDFRKKITKIIQSDILDDAFLDIHYELQILYVLK